MGGVTARTLNHATHPGRVFRSRKPGPVRGEGQAGRLELVEQVGAAAEETDEGRVHRV